MSRARPEASCVAVRGDRILGVGTQDELATWGPARVDDRFADKVLLPGFVEGHSHVMAGGNWELPYVGFFDRRDPSGRLWTGCRSFDDVIDRLAEVESTMTDRDAMLVAWASTRSTSAASASWPATSTACRRRGRSSSSTPTGTWRASTRC